MKHLILVLLMAILVSGCGARKSEKNRSNEETKIEQIDKSKSDKSKVVESDKETNVKRSEQTIVDDKTKSKTVKETIEPIDPCKESSYTDSSGKKQTLNNAKKTTETTIENKDVKTDAQATADVSNKEKDKSSKKESNDNNIKSKAAAKKGTEEIKTQREAWSVLNWLWLLIPLGFLVLVIKNRSRIVNWVEGVW